MLVILLSVFLNFSSSRFRSLYINSRMEARVGGGEMASVKLSAPTSQWVRGRKPLDRGPSIRPAFMRVSVPVVRAGSYTDELVQTAVSELPNPNAKPSLSLPAISFISLDDREIRGPNRLLVISPFDRDWISRFRFFEKPESCNWFRSWFIWSFRIILHRFRVFLIFFFLVVDGSFLAWWFGVLNMCVCANSKRVHFFYYLSFFFGMNLVVLITCVKNIMFVRRFKFLFIVYINTKRKNKCMYC